MKFVRTLLTNHPLVNILFTVVLVMGAVSYMEMPREQDPEINFNFVSIDTVLPGATAADVESLVTGPLEDALRNVRDIKFVSSTSRENSSVILIRCRELSKRDFDKRIATCAGKFRAKPTTSYQMMPRTRTSWKLRRPTVSRPRQWFWSARRTTSGCGVRAS